MADFTTSKVDGNTVAAIEWNQLADLDNLTSSTGLTPSTSNLYQTAISSARYSSAGNYFTDSGTANAYILSSVSPFNSPVSATAGEGYFVGMRIRFRAGNNNTGASTVNVNSAGVKNLVLEDGATTLPAGIISTTADSEFRYDGTAFRIVRGIRSSAYLQPNRNILINGAMAIDQRNNGVGQTITAGAALVYTVDRWYAYCTGANVTSQRISGVAPNQYNYGFTGAAGVTKIGFAQRIEASNSQHLAGNTVTLSVDLSNSLLTTVTWTVWYANSVDTFGTLASPTRTQIATGTWTVSSTLTRYSTSIAIPSAATTGIEVEFSVASQTSGTLIIGRAQLENSPEQTTFDYRQIQQELTLCQRYYEAGVVWAVSYNSSGSQIQRCLLPFKTVKRASPTSTYSIVSGSITSPVSADIDTTNAWISFSSTSGGQDGKISYKISAEL